MDYARRIVSKRDSKEMQAGMGGGLIDGIGGLIWVNVVKH